MPCAAPQRAEAKTNNDRADKRDILRPKASEKAPQIGVVAVLATIYPVAHQKALSLGAFSSNVIAGRVGPRTTALNCAMKGIRDRDAMAR
jgi:hypothetical protein